MWTFFPLVALYLQHDCEDIHTDMRIENGVKILGVVVDTMQDSELVLTLLDVLATQRNTFIMSDGTGLYCSLDDVTQIFNGDIPMHNEVSHVDFTFPRGFFCPFESDPIKLRKKLHALAMECNLRSCTAYYVLQMLVDTNVTKQKKEMAKKMLESLSECIDLVHPNLQSLLKEILRKSNKNDITKNCRPEFNNSYIITNNSANEKSAHWVDCCA